MTGLHSLKKSPTQRTKQRIGRGGKRGKTSGHGHKGQKQHGRHGIRPEMRDFIKKLPKLRGHGINRSRTVNSSRVAFTPVNLAQLEEAFKSGETVTAVELVLRSVISPRAGRAPKVKILGRGTLTHKLTIEGCSISEAAKKAVEAAGGSVA
ncbi:50S ribosomal protein L15 [Candidatus Kaiserbacteria bacterium]|nr:MAG: 50S ribosomal protein L15 [Candidatus Kaiserbacteria bacterium]PCI89903.1 MAG: 50S ribosomal protein L15 [Candidatus Kaiserbacteria bacterium]